MFNINSDDEHISDTASETTIDNLYNQALRVFEDFDLDSFANLQTFDAIYEMADYDTAVALALTILELDGRHQVSLSQNIWSNIASYNNLQSLCAVLSGLGEENALTNENLDAIFANPDAASDLNEAYFDTNSRGELFLPEFLRIITESSNDNNIVEVDESDYSSDEAMRFSFR